MKMNSSKMLFMTSMLLGILMSISASNWILIWCGLEISLVSFIPLMLTKKKMSSESMMKYFIIQSISSAMLMLGIMLMIMKGDYNYEYVLSSSLLIKMGVFPFHTWVLTVVEGMDIIIMMILLTINKVVPLVIMSYIKNNLSIIVMMTVIMPAIMSLNQNSIKKMIAYSSIFNMGFILSIIKMNLLWMMYLALYSILMMMIMITMTTYNNNFINQMVFSESIVVKMTMWTTLLSLGGMPPMIGFYIKYMVMSFMIQIKFIPMIVIMVISSLLVMFFYLRMTFMSIVIFSVKSKINLFLLNETSMWLMMINLFITPIIFLTKNI